MRAHTALFAVLVMGSGCFQAAPMVGAEASLKVCVADTLEERLDQPLRRCTKQGALEVTLAFGTAAKGELPVRTIRLSNLGDTNVTLKSIDIGAGLFTLAAPPMPHELTVGDTLDVFVTFDTTIRGSTSTTVTIVSTDALADVLSVNVSGAIAGSTTGTTGAPDGGHQLQGDAGVSNGPIEAHDAGTAWGTILSLPFQVTDAEFSRALNTLVVVSENPNAVQLIDGTTGTIRSVALGAPPHAVSLSPDGHRAVIGHDGGLTLVDLDSTTVTATLPARCDVFDVVYGANTSAGAYAYVYPANETRNGLTIVNLSTGAETISNEALSVGHHTIARLHPLSGVVYQVPTVTSPARLERFSIQDPLKPKWLYDTRFGQSTETCGNFWFGEGGEKLYSRCAELFTATQPLTTNPLYAGSLVGIKAVRWLDDSIAANALVVIRGSTNIFSDPLGVYDVEVRLIERTFQNPIRTDELPSFPGTRFPSHGRFVFWNSAASRYLVLAQGDDAARATNKWALLVHDEVKP